MAGRLSRSVSSMAAMAALLLLALMQSAIHGHAASPDVGTVKIEKFTFAGTGCEPGSTEGVVSDDGRALTIMFSQYTATTDTGSDGLRKQCTVTAVLSYPPGFRFHLVDCTMRGYAKLDAGVKGTIQTSYHFSGVAGTARITRNIAGAVDENYEFTDTFGTLVLSECGSVRNLNLNSEVRVNAGSSGGSGLLTMDSQDLRLTQEFAIVWESC